MSRRRRSVLVAFSISSALAVSAAPAPAEAKKKKPATADAPRGCSDGDDVRIWLAPQAPTTDRPLRMLAVSEQPRGAPDLVVTGPDGARKPLPTTRRGGPPFGFEASLPAPAAGRHKVELIKDGKVLACRHVSVEARAKKKGAPGPAAAPRAPATGIWATSRGWDRAMESFYSAWIESLFDAPLTENLSFRPLAQALRDPARNFFFDYLGLGEDAPKGKSALVAAPDCADLPYFLRAYFSWKMALPYGLRDCDRGAGNRPPRCGELQTNEMPLPPPAVPGTPANTATAGTVVAVAAPPPPPPPPPAPPKGTPAKGAASAGAPADALTMAKKYLRLLANKVHSGSPRTALADDGTDFYPVALTREALRPGTVYADPYGHVLMIVKWIDQGGGAGGAASPGAGGMLLAVDGQPDGSVARKRFWEGTFLYANDVPTAGPGFKAFRPLVKGKDGALAPLTNAALRSDRRFAPFSAEQGELGKEAFYARMGKLINPRGLDPAAAYGETLNALVEQIETRIGSVDNGEKYMRETKDPLPVAMPEGSKIFETVGAWEDYATPSRDMRLLIAIDVLEGLPEQIVRHPELFNLGNRKPQEARAEVERLHAAKIKERGIEYRRSDGSMQKLTVADVLARKAGFEISYNPNDCIEIRWGAPAGSPEMGSCKRRAPEDQQKRMAQHRAWFHDRRRPSR